MSTMDPTRSLRAWFEADAPSAAPPELLDGVFTTTRRMRPLPAWRARLAVAPMRLEASVAVGSPALRVGRVAVGLIILVLAGLAIAIAGGLLRQPRLPVLPSTTDAWSRVMLGPGDVMNAIAPRGSGLIAVGRDANLAGAIWSSPDGRVWSRVADVGPMELQDVVPGGPGFVAVVAEGGWVNPPSEGNQAPIWTSETGEQWARVPADPVFEGAWLRSIVASKNGLVAVGSSVDGAQAWYSSDGIHWRLATMPPPPRRALREGGYVQAWMRDVAASPDRLVAVGIIVIQADHGIREQHAIWTSEDGRTWKALSLDPVAFPAGAATLNGVARGPSGFVAVGGGGDRADARIWTSADGRDWRLVTDGQAAFEPVSTRPSEREDVYLEIHAVASNEGGYVAVGGDAACTYNVWTCLPAQSAVWTSPDGEAWTRVPNGPVFQVGETGRVGMRTVTPWGSRFMAAGTFIDPTTPTTDQAAVWLSEVP